MELKVGIQLYSVRQHMAENPLATIEHVVNAGYKYLEAANHYADKDDGVGFGVDAAKLKSVLDSHQARIVSVHVYPFEKCDLDAVIRYNQEIGNENLVMPMGFFSSKEEILAACDEYNRYGEKCARSGMTLLYHNHYQEYQVFGGKTVMEWMLEKTDPALLKFELDTFWTLRGGHDPVEVMKMIGKRLKLVHQKDFSKTSATPVNILSTIPPDAVINMETGFGGNLFKPEDFTEIGHGIMDIQSIINTANDLGSVEYIILEQDFSAHDEMESIRISMDSFRKFSNVSWT